MSKHSKVSLENAKQLLRSAGLRCTTNRVAVMRHLASAPAPLTHAEAADSLEPLGIDRSTVFRCLNDLAEAGLATRFDLGDHMWRFGMRGCEGQEVEEHPHFLCTSCGKAVCLHQVKVRITPVSRTQESQEDWGDIEEVILKGHCPACRA